MDTTYAANMKRTTVFLPEELKCLLQERARRTRRTQAEIVREALSQYLRARFRPWPRSVDMGEDVDHSVTSEHVKDWVRDRWRRELEDGDSLRLADLE